MTFVLLVIFDYLAKFGNPFVEWVEITLVVHPGLIHVVQYLLYDIPNTLASVLYFQARTEYEGPLEQWTGLTRIDAIWE